MATTKKPVFTMLLPPTPCTPQMREDLINYAASIGESIAEIQRRSFALFLAENFSKAKVENIHTIETELERG